MKTYNDNANVTMSTIRAAKPLFFERGTMRFFNSRVADRCHTGPGGVFFVTSETDMHNKDRRYTVRQFHPDTERIDTAGEFRGYADGRTANAAATYFAKHGAPTE